MFIHSFQFNHLANSQNISMIVEANREILNLMPNLEHLQAQNLSMTTRHPRLFSRQTSTPIDSPDHRQIGTNTWCFSEVGGQISDGSGGVTVVTLVPSS